jgi:thiol:disulfide interchange protein DsbD
MKYIFSALLLLFTFCLNAQPKERSHWEFSTKKISNCEYELIFNVSIDKDWHLYAINVLCKDGPNALIINFDSDKNYKLIGKVKESKVVKKVDNAFGCEVAFHENKAVFTQRIQLLTNKEFVLKGTYQSQECKDDEGCTFPPPLPFEFKLKGSNECTNKGVKLVPASIGLTVDSTVSNSTENIASIDSSMNRTLSKPSTKSSQQNTNALLTSDESSIQGKSWWAIYLTGFLFGFLALLTPCVFPLIPMNVSFFLKRGNNHKKGRIDALIYTLSIIVIFTTLGLIISAVWGGGALHAFSTSVGFNSVIFVMLLVFAISFLGAFEITLPSNLVNKIDKQSDRGGFVGIFFMALTLVVVSFSCTGPLVGNALVEAAKAENTSGAFWAFFGFSSGLALPFGFFAFFPTMLHSIPKSGGWLNSVKVVLGFLELALALKFASNIDLVYQLHILTREVFLTLWVVIFALMTIYLLGGFKTAHDSDTTHISVTRLFFVILSFSVTIYLIPGLWGAPLKLFSGVLPPQDYSESPHGFGAKESSEMSVMSIDDEFSKYMDVNKNGIIHFKNNYEQALAYAKKTGKPLMVDFTGHACANCRKTEDYIWSDEEVKKRLNNNVVLVSLYVDDKRKLDEKEFEKVFWYGREIEITTIGDKFKYMEETLYKQSTQPLYVLLDTNEQLLNKPRGYQSGIEEYTAWLDEGVAEFKKQHLP